MKRFLFTSARSRWRLPPVRRSPPIFRRARKRRLSPPPPLWSGFYGGLNIGGGWDANGGQSGASAYYDPSIRLPRRPPQVPTCSSCQRQCARQCRRGGAQVGYNFQFNQFVLGVETDFQGTSISSSGNNAPLTLYQSPLSPNYLTPVGPDRQQRRPVLVARARRVGYLITPTLLIYAQRASPMGRWTLGALATPAPAGPPARCGVDVRAALVGEGRISLCRSLQQWRANSGWNVGYNFQPQINVVRAGVNYHFNWGAPAPEDVALAHIEVTRQMVGRSHHVPAMYVYYSFRLAGGTRGVKQESGSSASISSAGHSGET